MNKIDLQSIVNKYSKNEEYNFTGYLMYKDKLVAEIKNTEIVKYIDDNLLPVIMINKNAGSFESWLQTRVIDTHRTNSRQVRRRLSVKSEVPKEIVIKARAISITDNYWLKCMDEDISFNEVRNNKPILTEYEYDIPKIDLKNIKEIVNDTLKDFPILMKEDGFSEVVFKIIKNNYEELLKK